MFDKILPFLGAAALLVLPQLAPAHHSHSNIDRSNIQQHAGVVTEYSWTQPHVFLKVMAPNQHGEAVEYSIELLHPPGMMRRGWSKDSFKPGDRITWEGASDYNPDRYYSGLSWAERGDGARFVNSREQRLPEEVQPSTDFTGLWIRDLRGGPPHHQPPADWPYTALAQEQIDNFSEDQNPALDCIKTGPPKATLLPYPIHIRRPNGETIIMDYELREKSRIVHLNSDQPPGEPSTWGHSIGRFEGDELVVETSNFLADRWGTHTGVNSSDQKHLIERFRLGNDGLALEVEITVSDPAYLAKPVTFDYYMAKIQSREMVHAACTIENARLFLEAGFSQVD